MPCYTKRLKQLLKAVGLEDSPENRLLVHRQLQLLYREDQCPLIWNKVKSSLREPQELEMLARELASAPVTE